MPHEGSPHGANHPGPPGDRQKKSPHREMGGFAFARPPYFLVGAAVMAVANSSVMLK